MRGAGAASGATIAAVLDDAAAALAAAGFDEPRRQARRLVAVALGLSPAEVVARPEHALPDADRAKVDGMLHRMVAGEPLTRIVASREFWGLEFRLSADTLDPRPESETVVEAVLAHLPERGRAYRLLDLGTGTGCLLLALLAEFPASTGVGIDVAPGAVRTARDNAGRLGFAARARFVAGDWAAAIGGRFDAVVANPPYIASAAIRGLPPEVREHDPHRALDGGADGLAAYRAIAPQLRRLLLPAGIFAAEIGAGQAGDVAAILSQGGLEIAGLAHDLAGFARCIVAWGGP